MNFFAFGKVLSVPSADICTWANKSTYASGRIPAFVKCLILMHEFCDIKKRGSFHRDKLIRSEANPLPKAPFISCSEFLESDHDNCLIKEPVQRLPPALIFFGHPN